MTQSGNSPSLSAYRDAKVSPSDVIPSRGENRGHKPIRRVAGAPPNPRKDLGPPKCPTAKSTLAFPIMMISPWPSPTKREGSNGAI